MIFYNASKSGRTVGLSVWSRKAWLEKPGWTGRDLPLWDPLIPFPGGDPGDSIHNENGPFLLLSNCFSAIVIVTLVVLDPLRHLGTLFLEGPQGLVPSTSGIISPALSQGAYVEGE